MSYEITVEHSIDAGHRVLGHEDGRGKCARLHGHTYRFTVSLVGVGLDAIGFVADFGVVKAALDEWDHRLVLHGLDPVIYALAPEWDSDTDAAAELERLGIVPVPFNPTAENMARHYAERFAELDGVIWARVKVSETPKTTASFTASNGPEQQARERWAIEPVAPEHP